MIAMMIDKTEAAIRADFYHRYAIAFGAVQVAAGDETITADERIEWIKGIVETVDRIEAEVFEAES